MLCLDTEILIIEVYSDSSVWTKNKHLHNRSMNIKLFFPRRNIKCKIFFIVQNTLFK